MRNVCVRNLESHESNSNVAFCVQGNNQEAAKDNLMMNADDLEVYFFCLPCSCALNIQSYKTYIFF